MKQKPNMNFWGLWNLSFGFFGLGTASISRKSKLRINLPSFE